MNPIIFENQKEKLENYDANKEYKKSLEFIKQQYKVVYDSLKEPCKSCLGCSRLENPNFTGDINCKYKTKEGE